jgi:hypothetical protein
VAVEVLTGASVVQTEALAAEEIRWAAPVQVLRTKALRVALALVVVVLAVVAGVVLAVLALVNRLEQVVTVATGCLLALLARALVGQAVGPEA